MNASAWYLVLTWIADPGGVFAITPGYPSNPRPAGVGVDIDLAPGGRQAVEGDGVWWASSEDGQRAEWAHARALIRSRSGWRRRRRRRLRPRPRIAAHRDGTGWSAPGGRRVAGSDRRSGDRSRGGRGPRQPARQPGDP